MANIKLANIAKETMKISSQGFYKIGNQKIELSGKEDCYSFTDVIVLDEKN